MDLKWHAPILQFPKLTPKVDGMPRDWYRGVQLQIIRKTWGLGYDPWDVHVIIEALMYMIKVKVSTYSIFSISFHSHLYRLCIFTFLRHRRYCHFSLHIGVHDFFFVSVHSASYKWRRRVELAWKKSKNSNSGRHELEENPLKTFLINNCWLVIVVGVDPTTFNMIVFSFNT